MSWFQRPPPPSGWIAIAPDGAQAVLACVDAPPPGPATPLPDSVLSGHADAPMPTGRPQVRWVQVADWGPAPGAALRSLARPLGLKDARRVLVLPRAQYRLATLDTPADVPRAEWADAVRWQLKDSVDFPVDGAAVDVLAVPEGASYRPQPQLIAVAAPEAAVRPQVAEAHAAGLPWTAIDIAETALRNLGARVEPDGRAQALLHCGEQHSTLVVTYGGELLATRQFELSHPALASADTAARQAAWDQAVLELQRTLDGIERSFGQVSLARLLLTPMPGLADFAEHLRPLLYVPVELFDVHEALDLSAVPELLADDGLLNRALCAIGAALRDAP